MIYPYCEWASVTSDQAVRMEKGVRSRQPNSESGEDAAIIVMLRVTWTAGVLCIGECRSSRKEWSSSYRSEARRSASVSVNGGHSHLVRGLPVTAF